MKELPSGKDNPDIFCHHPLINKPKLREYIELQLVQPIIQNDQELFGTPLASQSSLSPYISSTAVHTSCSEGESLSLIPADKDKADTRQHRRKWSKSSLHQNTDSISNDPLLLKNKQNYRQLRRDKDRRIGATQPHGTQQYGISFATELLHHQKATTTTEHEPQLVFLKTARGRHIRQHYISQTSKVLRTAERPIQVSFLSIINFY